MHRYSQAGAEGGDNAAVRSALLALPASREHQEHGPGQRMASRAGSAAAGPAPRQARPPARGDYDSHQAVRAVGLLFTPPPGPTLSR